MTTRRRQFYCFGTVALMLGGNLAHAEGITGEVQVVSVPSKDKRVQRSLTEVSVYLEYEITSEVSAFGVGYHDQEFRSTAIGLAKRIGNWQVGMGLGHAAFDDISHLVINPWAHYSNDSIKVYLHYEQYKNGSSHSNFAKGYALRHLGEISMGIYAERDFGLGPRIEARLAEGLRLWGVVPIARRPTEGEMKAMIGLTAEF